MANEHATAVEPHADDSGGTTLRVLEAIALDSRVTQRSLANTLGIAVGLTNLYLKRMARKGYIKFVSVRPNRIVYLITPKGIAEKSRLTYEFMQGSLVLYRQVRAHLSTTVREYVQGSQGVALYGTGEAAELAYLCLRENGLEPAAIFDRERGRFLGMLVHDVRDHASIPFDVLIVARLEQPDAVLAELVKLGIPRDRLVTLRPPLKSKSSRPAAFRAQAATRSAGRRQARPNGDGQSAPESNT